MTIALERDRLYALGGSIANDGTLTWFPEALGGFVPINCYLLVEGRSGLLVDTCLPVMEDEVVRQAREFDLDDVGLLLTRTVEFESVGNAEPLVGVLPVRRTFAHFTADEWFYFRPEGSTFQSDPRDFEFEALEDGMRIAVGPGRDVTVINAKLKLLATAWIYDHATRTLFTSDSFSHVPAADPQTRVLEAGDDRDSTSLEDVLSHLLAKFDWLREAETEPLRRFLDGVFSEFDVETIAPASGCILRGRSLVERHHSLLDEALLELGTQSATAEEALR
jgi:flavorubredoxin